MHHHMPPSKTGWPSLNVVILPPGDAPRPGRPKTVTTPEIIDKIHELFLEDGRISAKSIAEQLGISREQVGSIIHEDLDMRKLSAKGVPKCLNKIENVNGASRLSKFWNFFGAIQTISCRARLVTMDETWLYYITMTWRQSKINGVAA